MATQTPYNPLQKGHFRLLELVGGSDADGSSIEELHFRMHEVPLKQFKESTASSRQGSEKQYEWPEVQRIRYDFRQLFLQKAHIAGVQKYIDNLGDVEEKTASTSEVPLSATDLSSFYVALSYCWGPSGSNRAIILNGQRWPVSENLFLVLQQLSLSQAVQCGCRIWTDALSINQADIPEKEEQINQMRTIYARAWQVVIWLGEEAPYTELAFGAVRWLARGHYNDEGAPVRRSTHRTFIPYLSFIQASWSDPANNIRFSTDVYLGLWQLFTRPYWRRLWILQEIALAKANAPVLWGQYCVSLDELKLAAEFISENELAIGMQILVHPRVDMPDRVRKYDMTIDREIEFQGKSPSRLWKLSLKIMRLGLLETSHKSQVVNAFDALALAKSASATDERDKVFGILGIPNVEKLTRVEPNYRQSLTEVYTGFSRRILLTGDLNLLRLTHHVVGDLDDSFRIHQKQKQLPNGWRYYTAFLDSSVFSDNVQNVVSSTLGLHPTRSTIPPCTHSLPSWAVCWSCSYAPTLALPNDAKTALDLDTWLFRLWTGRPFSSNRVTCDNGILSVHGVFVDDVVSLSACHSLEDDRRFPLSGGGNHEDADRTIESIREDLWRALVADLDTSGASPASDDCSVLLLRDLWGAEYAHQQVMTSNPFSLEQFYKRNSSLTLCGYPLSELLLDCQKCADAKLDKPETLEIVKRVMNLLAWRRLISTDVGSVGLAVAAAEPNDRIAVLVGCDMPMILRPSGEHWQVVGECYVQGLMSGEVAGTMIASGKKLETITLR